MCLKVFVYDSDKVLIDTLRPSMYPMRSIAEASDAVVRQDKLCCSHALYLAAVKMYMT